MSSTSPGAITRSPGVVSSSIWLRFAKPNTNPFKSLVEMFLRCSRVLPSITSCEISARAPVSLTSWICVVFELNLEEPTVANTTAVQARTAAHAGIVHFRRCRVEVLLLVETVDSRSRCGKLRAGRNRRVMRGLLLNRDSFWLLLTKPQLTLINKAVR